LIVAVNVRVFFFCLDLADEGDAWWLLMTCVRI
jgi:hypothetical protein